MTYSPNIKLTINFNDPGLDQEELDEQVQRLINELQNVEEIETVTRVSDPAPPEGSKAIGGFLIGLLAAEVNARNAKHLLSFLGDRLSGKPIELEVEANGRKLKVKAHSREELEVAIKAAQDFVSQ
jgi:hypothetical protein